MSADGGVRTPLLAGRAPFNDEDNQVGLDFSKLQQVPKRTRTRTRVQDLMHQSQIPLFMRRECVVWHYRPQTRFSTAMLSVFRLHNDTVNIWSHAIGKYFLSVRLGGPWLLATRAHEYSMFCENTCDTIPKTRCTTVVFMKQVL